MTGKITAACTALHCITWDRVLLNYNSTAPFRCNILLLYNKHHNNMNSIQGSLHIYNIHVHVVMLKVKSVYTLTTSMLQPAVGYDSYCCYVVYTGYQRVFFRKGTIIFTYTVVTYTLHAKKWQHTTDTTCLTLTYVGLLSRFLECVYYQHVNRV